MTTQQQIVDAVRAAGAIDVAKIAKHVAAQLQFRSLESAIARTQRQYPEEFVRSQDGSS